ncbi:uncharacterized protein N7458_004338 [Penicillium daleae]|uniref:Uncharacterized protein n=1 Tax=Penicillium daleae TaxID=63821 RepID=A0AAD6CA06_9EURO|nr:uncharacterized protein N7458_004338 [Penicillium daleae]KAJ5456074.1 hypothetical protein N7458_004338 [Penicillium daleae]
MASLRRGPERLDFRKMEVSLDSSKMEREQKNHESDLNRLTRYFASRLEHFQSLEDVYRDLDPAGLVADDEALENIHRELDHNR